MARVDFEHGDLVVTLEGLERLVAARADVRMPLAHVVDAYPAPERARGWLADMRQTQNTGTHIPGLVKAGTFMTAEGPVFYAARDLRRAVAIDLEGERFRRLVIEPPAAESPQSCAQRVREAAFQVRLRPPRA
jgi:hypothetical protein